MKEFSNKMGNEKAVRDYRGRRFPHFIIAIIVLAVLLFIPFISIPASAQEGLEIDAAYLLDVSCSMLGQVVTPNILNQVIDILVNEVKSIDKGRIILITFAEGPHDLDKGPLSNGPIRPIYEFNLPEDHDNLLSFIRPNEYGKFRDPDTGEIMANWPGIYEATRRNCGGKTAIYDTAKYALDLLEELQGSYPGGKEAYAESHVQLLVVLTDGWDNASKLNFQDLLRIMDHRHWEMEKKFFYKRYYFGGEPPPKEPERPYIDNPDIKPPIPPFFRIRLDRPLLIFPGNLWFTGELSLDKVQLAKITGPAREISWGEISVKPEGFSLPEGVAVHVSTTPSPLRAPFTEGRIFNLNLELTPHPVLKDHLLRQGLVEGTIEGYLLFEFLPKRSDEGFVDFVYSEVPVKLSFQRPHMEVSLATEGEAFCLNLSYNEAFESLKEEQKAIVLDYNKDHLYLTDAEGNILKGDQFKFKVGRKLCLNVNPDLEPGTYKGRIKVLPDSKEVLINGRASFEEGYEFTIVGFDRKIFTFPNLWAPPAQIAADSRTVVLKDLQLYGLPADWDWDRLSIIPVGFELPVGVQFKLLNPHANRFELELMVTSYAQLLVAKAKINEAPVDGYLQFRYQGQGEGSAPRRLVRFKVGPGEPGMPVDLEFKRHVINIQFEDRTGSTLYREDPAISLRISYSEDLQGDERKVELQCNKEHFYLLAAKGERLDCGSITFSGDELTMKVQPQLSPGTYQGSWELSAIGEIWLEGLEPSLVQKHTGAYTFQVPYLIGVETAQLTFPNLWAYAEIKGNTRTVLSEEALHFSSSPDQPDWGKVTLKLAGFGLPKGLLRITPAELGPPFSGDKGKLQLVVTDFAELKRRISEGREALEGSLELGFIAEEAAKGKAKVEFAPRTEGNGEERLSIPMRIDLHQPNIVIRADPPRGELGTLHRREPAVTLGFEYDPILKHEQRKVIVECVGTDFQLFDEEGSELACGGVFAGKKLQLRVAPQASFGEHTGGIRINPAVIPDLKVNGGEGAFTYNYQFTIPSFLSWLLFLIMIASAGLFGIWLIGGGVILLGYSLICKTHPWAVFSNLAYKVGYKRFFSPLILAVIAFIVFVIQLFVR